MIKINPVLFMFNVLCLINPCFVYECCYTDKNVISCDSKSIFSWTSSEKNSAQVILIRVKKQETCVSFIEMAIEVVHSAWPFISLGLSFRLLLLKWYVNPCISLFCISLLWEGVSWQQTTCFQVCMDYLLTMQYQESWGRSFIVCSHLCFLVF